MELQTCTNKCSSRKNVQKGQTTDMLTKRANSAKRADIFTSMVGSKKSGPFGGNHGHKTPRTILRSIWRKRAQFQRVSKLGLPAIPANIQTTRTFVQNALKFSRSAEISKMRTFPHFQKHGKLRSCDVRGVYIYPPTPAGCWGSALEKACPEECSRDRQRQIETDRDRQRQTDRDRETERDRERERQRDRQTDRQTDR